MKLLLKDKDVPQWEVWILLVILFACVELGAWVLVIGDWWFPGFVSRFSGLYITTLTDVMALVYCVWRFGWLELVEFLPRRRDWLVLALAGMTVFLYFGITVGPEGMNTNTYNSIRDLPVCLYWLSVANIVGIGPFFEETIFRRYFLGILRQHYSTALAVVVTAGVATCFHYGLPLRSLVFIFCAQLLFGAVYVTSRLGVSVGVHAMMNSLVLLLSK